MSNGETIVIVKCYVFIRQIIMETVESDLSDHN